MVVISRSGTTTEVLDLIRATEVPTVAITATADSPIVELADQTILLDFADEQSVVQTRFATSTLALLRASLGEDLSKAAADAQTALTIDVDEKSRDRGLREDDESGLRLLGKLPVRIERARISPRVEFERLLDISLQQRDAEWRAVRCAPGDMAQRLAAAKDHDQNGCPCNGTPCTSGEEPNGAGQAYG